MAQEIILRRNTDDVTLTSLPQGESKAYEYLNAKTHKVGQPVVVLYNPATGDNEYEKAYGTGNKVAAIYAVGTGNGVGMYQAFSTIEDMLALQFQLTSLNTDYNTHKAAFNTFKNGLLTESTTFDDVKNSLFTKVTINGKTFIRANFDFFSTGTIAMGALGEGGETEAVALQIKVGDKYFSVKNGIIELDDYYTKTETDAKFATKTYVQEAIQDAKDLRVDTLIDETIPEVKEDITALQGAVTDLGGTVGNLPAYTIATYTVSDANVKEAFRLKKGNEWVGSTIKIYKDSALQEVYLGASTDTVNATTGVVTKNTVTDAQSLNFVYQLANGTYSLTKIDVSKFLTQSEFGNGLAVSSAGVVSVKIDSNSQSNLTVGSGGLKLTGVAQAEDLTALDTRVGTAETNITTLQGRTITAGKGLTGGGSLAANRTINVVSANDGITVNDDNIQLNTIDNVTSTSTTKPLSANQGKVLKGLIDSAQTDLDTLEAKTLSGGTATSASGSLSSGAKVNVLYDNTSIKVGTDNKLHVGVIDGGTF